MTLFYNITFTVFALLYIPILIIKGKGHLGLKMRLGCFDQGQIEQLNLGGNIWIHAVSVGEVLAVKELIHKIRNEYPKKQIVCTTVTPTGFSVAKEKLDGKVIVLYAPLDLSWIIRKYIKTIKPIVYIAAETEIWPNTYFQLKKCGVSICVINGRISDNSFRGYKKFIFLTKNVLKCVSCFCMQSKIDQTRIIELGADNQKTFMVGNIKFDVGDQTQLIDINQYGYSKFHQLFVAGSTHRGEEKLIVDMYKDLSSQYTDLRLILAPRHINRYAEIVQLVKNVGLKPRKFTDKNDLTVGQEDVMIVDEVGYLRSLYRISTIVFVGKSLIDGGGQNIIEPALYGKPILVGPYVQNFKDVVFQFLKEEALIQLKNSHELKNKLQLLLDDPAQAQRIGRKALEVVQKNRGATDRTMERLKPFIAK